MGWLEGLLCRDQGGVARSTPSSVPSASPAWPSLSRGPGQGTRAGATPFRLGVKPSQRPVCVCVYILVCDSECMWACACGGEVRSSGQKRAELVQTTGATGEERQT